jgi:vacuolar-type H+-ATPase subunit E/Vma4
MTLFLLRLLGPAVAGLVLGFVLQGWRMDAAVSKLKAEHQAAVSASIAKAHQETIRLQRIKDEAIEKAQKLAKSNALAADRARTELERLRSRLQADSGDLSKASRQSLANYTSTLQTVFAECGRELEEMARKADGHALDARTLKDAWAEPSGGE